MERFKDNEMLFFKIAKHKKRDCRSQSFFFGSIRGLGLYQKSPDGTKLGLGLYQKFPDGIKLGLGLYQKFPDGIKLGLRLYQKIPDGSKKGLGLHRKFPDGLNCTRINVLILIFYGKSKQLFRKRQDYLTRLGAGRLG